MKPNNYFPNLNKKLQLEALLRSLLCGLAVGFGAAFVASLVTWFTSLDGLWVAILALACGILISAPIFYFKRFRPTAVSSARRIDSLGLEERLITMVEFSDDNSIIAQLQRKDAKAALERTKAEQIKITISRAAIVSLAICAFFGIGMTTVNVLGEHGFFPSGDDIINSIIEEQTTEYVTISYVIEDGGILEGDEDQIIVKGTDATTVTAVADDGYVFKGWNDGSIDPTREDKEITEDIVYVAIFMPMQEGEDGDGDGDGDGEEGDEGDNDAPSNSEEEGDNKEQGQEPPPGENQPNPGAGGKYEPNNQIIDGNKFYRDELNDKYRDEALALLEDENSGLTEAEKELIKKYFGIV